MMKKSFVTIGRRDYFGLGFLDSQLKTALSKWINRPREILQPRPIGIKQIGEIEVISFLACTQAAFRFWAF